MRQLKFELFNPDAQDELQCNAMARNGTPLGDWLDWIQHGGMSKLVVVVRSQKNSCFRIRMFLFPADPVDQLTPATATG